MEIKTGLYKHFKKGLLSLVVCGGAARSDDSGFDVVYFGLTDKTWHTRPVESFCDMVVGANGEKVARFELVKEMNINDVALEISKIQQEKSK